jgi:hypothetical protein
MNAQPFLGIPAVIKPVITDLPGRIRVLLRNDDFAMCFIRNGSSTRQFPLSDEGDHWAPCLEAEQAANLTIR